jgi:hypothetical protein
MRRSIVLVFPALHYGRNKALLIHNSLVLNPRIPSPVDQGTKAFKNCDPKLYSQPFNFALTYKWAQ